MGSRGASKRAGRRGGAAADEALRAPEGLVASRGTAGDLEYAVLEWSVGTRIPPSLSPAEAEVAALVAEGRTNAEIAAARGTSARTVANQVASALRKLGVESRHDLVAAITVRPC